MELEFAAQPLFCSSCGGKDIRDIRNFLTQPPLFVPIFKGSILVDLWMANLPPSAVVTAAGQSFIPLPNPLAVKVSALRKPELILPLSDVEFTEPGDVLHDVFVAPDAVAVRGLPGSTCLPTIVFPGGTRGRHFVGEFFRAMLSFRNTSSTYPLTRLYFRIELISPQNQRIVLYDREAARLDMEANKDIRVEQQIGEDGQYTLTISVSYSDPTNELKRFSWSTTFIAERTVTEASRKIYPLAPQAGNSLPKYIVAVALQNTCDIPVVLTNVRLIARAGFQSTPIMSGSQTGGFAHSYTGGGKDSLADIFFQPKETRVFTYEIVSTIQQQQQQMMIASSSSTAFSASPTTSTVGSRAVVGSPAGSSALPKPTDIGHVEWEWRRHNGDGGVDFSSVLRLPRPILRPEFEAVFHPVVGAAPGDARGSEGELFASVNEPLAVQVTVSNRSPSRRDVALHIFPHKLLPYFTYTGSCVVQLGVVERGQDLVQTVHLVPLLAGLLNATGGFELRDARQPDVVLWPVRPSSSMPPPLVQSLAGTSSGGSVPSTPGGVLALPPEQWPLKNFEVLVF